MSEGQLPFLSGNSEVSFLYSYPSSLTLVCPPQYTHLHSNVHPCPEHKESLCEVFTYPRPPATHLPAPTSGGLALSLSPCTWCAPFAGWWTEWDEAKVHTPFLFAWRGGLAAQGPPHMCHRCCPSQLFARQFVHSFRVQTCICCHIILAALNCPPLLQLPFPIQRPGQSFRQSISITSYITCPQPKIQCQYFCMMQKQLVLWDLLRILGFPENAVCLPPPSAPWGVKPVARSSKWYHTSCRPTIQLSQFKIICRWESTIWRPHRLALQHTDPVTCFHTHAHTHMLARHPRSCPLRARSASAPRNSFSNFPWLWKQYTCLNNVDISNALKHSSNGAVIGSKWIQDYQDKYGAPSLYRNLQKLLWPQTLVLK